MPNNNPLDEKAMTRHLLNACRRFLVSTPHQTLDEARRADIVHHMAKLATAFGLLDVAEKLQHQAETEFEMTLIETPRLH